MPFNPYRNSLKFYHPSDAHGSKNCFTVVSTHLPPKRVFLTLAWRHLPWGRWNLKVESLGLHCKQTPQVILVKVVHRPQFKKLYFNVGRYLLRIFVWYQNDDCVGFGFFLFLSFSFFNVVGGSELKLNWLKWSDPLT